MEKVAAGPVENAAAGLHTLRVEHELCVGQLHPSCCELRVGEIPPGHGELGKRSTRCPRAGFRSGCYELHTGDLHPRPWRAGQAEHEKCVGSLRPRRSP